MNSPPETDPMAAPATDSPDPDAPTPDNITTTCPLCGWSRDHPNAHQPHCPKCGADLAELFSAVYHPRPAPWARWVAWAILFMFAATLVLALLAIVFGSAPQLGP